ncbi:MAG: hypothetical protein KC416_17075, partial [Myxococcales bacterium]|nr:hypothetical protein [Myxococcales bacterium]
MKASRIYLVGLLLSFLMMSLGCSENVSPKISGTDGGTDASTDGGEKPDGAIPNLPADPFSYFLKPTDQLGFQDSPQAFQLTHDGALNTLAGELDFQLGPKRELLDQPIRTLKGGYQPVFLFHRYDRGVDYRFEAFAAPHALDPRENLVCFVRVTAVNVTNRTVETAFSATFRDRRDSTRHELKAPTWYRNRFMDAEAFDKSVVTAVEPPFVTKGTHLLMALGSSLGEAFDASAGSDPQVLWSFELEPGAEETFEFRIPYVPIERGRTAEVAKFMGLDHGETRDAVEKHWDTLLAAGTGFSIPEPKVEETSKTSLIYDLMARDIDETGKLFTQKVNEFQYDAFFPRDAAYFAYTYDLLGHHQIAEEVIEHFLLKDGGGSPTALRRIYPDDWGQS